jgi:hypothetical protein
VAILYLLGLTEDDPQRKKSVPIEAIPLTEKNKELTALLPRYECSNLYRCAPSVKAQLIGSTKASPQFGPKASRLSKKSSLSILLFSITLLPLELNPDIGNFDI